MGAERILLVDDEPDFTDTMRLVLESDGYYEVAVENDATRALTAAREFDPDLVILDPVAFLQAISRRGQQKEASAPEPEQP